MGEVGLVSGNADEWAVFSSLMSRSHFLGAHDLPDHVARHAADLGLADAHLYLVDLQQQKLVPFPPPDGPGPSEHASALNVDSTLAGRAFQQVTTLTAAGDAAGHGVSGTDGQGRMQVWVPLLNGTERLGVLAVTMDSSASIERGTPSGDRLKLFASIVAELVMTKTMYGDTLVRLRRLAPMGLAAEIQWSLLPPLTFENADVSIAAALEPAYDVAGDSVDYAVDAGIARFAVFDGMGHELPSAQLVSLVVAAYRNARRTGQGLTSTLRHVDEAVTASYQDVFTTAVLAELDTTTGLLTWVSAGHPPPLLLRDGQHVKTLELQPQLPLGLGLPDGDVHVGSEHLQPGDHVLVYTDGVVEARSPGGEPFGEQRLTDLIRVHLAANLSAAETMRRTVAALLEHQGSDLADDATLLLAQWKPENLGRLLP